MAILGSVVVYSFGRAENDGQVDWIGGNPSFAKEADYTDASSIQTLSCVKGKLMVMRSLAPSANAFEDQCVTQTAMGLMTDIYYTSGVVQPSGYTKAYPINYVAGGNPIIRPVPNQASGLYMMGGYYGSMYFGLFHQISNHMKMYLGSSGWYYYVGGNDQTPDYMFRSTKDGTLAAFNQPTASFSNNGRYMVVDTTANGYVVINMMNFKIKAVAETMPRISSGSPVAATTAISDDGKVAAIAHDGDWGNKYFKLVDVGKCTNGELDNVPYPASYNCPTVDVRSELLKVVPTLAYVASLRFSNERTLLVDVAYKDAQNKMKYAALSMTAFGQTKRLKEYLALGDSFISGEGAYNYRLGTDTDRNACHQSLDSYPYLLSSHFSSFAAVTCSGAKIQHVIKDVGDIFQVKGLKPDGDENSLAYSERMPGYVLQSEFVEKDNPEAVTLSIGGNDIGFGGIIERCVNPLKTPYLVISCYDSWEDRVELTNLINSQFSRLKKLYETLKKAGTGNRRVYVIGYPQVLKPDGSCGLNVMLDRRERDFAEQVIKQINKVVQSAADQAGVMYVDTQHAFDGHRLCEGAPGDVAVNGVTLSLNPRSKVDLTASYHPNKLGHRLLADWIAGHTQNLQKAMPVAAPNTNEIITAIDAEIFRDAPKTGRPLSQIINLEGVLSGLATIGQPLSFIVGQESAPFKPGGTYKVSVSGKPVQTVVADGQGSITVSGMVPAGLAAGVHVVHVTGTDIFGNPIDAQQPVFVAPSLDDSDGDGLPNVGDPCPLGVQSGIDYDADGIDDACDAEIGLPPATPPGNGGGVSDEGIIWWENAILPVTLESGVTSGP